ncbi:hypothetical protein CC117_33335 [Parafrankia colletiae]|uniref:Tetratricopeptide repeat protein n=2 Tax=Parafrankia colletiae TaxID=573497 RepID=A0A1S1R4A7_9ACTN|nr:tetratricopeptide repeat protein [Parafrankia colletiae]MCK9904746.1 tetratricopeptide repeat protein [Frankia sp. Cpl3]OHV41020.1 hypothetical protein CC117_33335 [Parafrankia colletiae]
MANDDQSGTIEADGAALYQQASELDRRGRPEEALIVLDQLLEDQPDHLEARFARALCLVEVDRSAEALTQLRRVLDSEPGHYKAAYHLGRILEAEADYEGAFQAYQQVLAVTPFRDTPNRLRACVNALGAGRSGILPGRGVDGHIRNGVVIEPGPPSVREGVEAHRTADRGALYRSVRLKTRHLIPSLGMVFLVCAVGTMLLALATGGISGSALVLFPVFVMTSLAGTIWFLVWAFVQVRTNSAEFYERGVEVRSGFRRRSIQFIWYYQITGPPVYTRAFRNYFTKTATLCIRYNVAGAMTVETVEIAGFGTPAEVIMIGRHLESRVVAESLVIRGPLM